MKNFIKPSHTAIFTGPMGSVKSRLVLDVIEKNTTNIFTTSLLSVSCYKETRHIMLKLGSDRMTMLSLYSLKTSHINGKRIVCIIYH